MRVALPARTALAMALSLGAVPLTAHAIDNEALLAQIKALVERVERLEAQNTQLRSALESDRISENEPELVTRLKAVEAQQQALQTPAKKLEAFDGISVEGSLTGAVQQAGRGALADPASGRSRSNYRGDVAVTLPGGDFGKNKGTVYVHARFGQGDGLALRPTYTGTANSTAFGGDDPNDTQFTVAQAWYQLEVPFTERNVLRKTTFTVGKIDPFVFFDQNAIADDETRRFANNVFVHNPLLDSGGDVGADRFGFAPGAIAAYEDTSDKAMPWGVSLGAFGSGGGASFSGSNGKPLVIAQAWVSPRINALPGTYRAYAWSNARATNFDDSEARHSGFGLSIDQRVTDSLTLFGRYGHQTTGDVRFDRVLTVGGELDGSSWGRGADGVGLAMGMLRTSSRFAAASAADLGIYGHAAHGAERIGELYYRIHLNDHVELTPSLQYIARPAANLDGKGITLVGVRARVGF
jgi:hypothetical protein